MYDSKKASQYWDIRIKNFDLQSAVLSLSLPKYLNDAYASWELQTLRKVLGKIKNKKITDIACGGGRIAIPLAKMGAKVTGIDISQEMLNYAKKNAIRNRCSSNVKFFCNNAWNTELTSNSFDKVLLLGILEHLPDKYKKLTIKEAHRITKKHGSVYIVINNKKSFFLRRVRKWKTPIQQKSGYYSSLMNRNQIISYLKSLNFDVNIINSNLNYSILLHTLELIDHKTITKKDMRKISQLFQYYINLDLNNMRNGISSKLYDSLEETYADQYFIMARKK
jgi:ubiquinone/menaquinone biosynthesis C-methylase UbiE